MRPSLRQRLEYKQSQQLELHPSLRQLAFPFPTFLDVHALSCRVDISLSRFKQTLEDALGGRGDRGHRTDWADWANWVVGRY